MRAPGPGGGGEAEGWRNSTPTQAQGRCADRQSHRTSPTDPGLASSVPGAQGLVREKYVGTRDGWWSWYGDSFTHSSLSQPTLPSLNIGSQNCWNMLPEGLIER